MDGFEPGKVPEVRQHDATEERVELGTDRAESEHAQDMSLGWHRRPSEPFVDADRLPDAPSVCSSPRERTRTRRPVQGIAFGCCEVGGSARACAGSGVEAGRGLLAGL